MNGISKNAGGRLAALVLLPLALGGWMRPHQDGVSPAELHQITCAALQLPFVRAAVERGAGPLLIITGRDYGVVRTPAEPCPAQPQLPRGASEIRFIRPNTAPQMYGARGVNGALLVDLPPLPAR